MKRFLLLVTLLLSFGNSKAQLYFPPVPAASGAWQTMNPADLGWCQEKIDNLYDYLELTNSKAFIVLKDGKIVLEKYFGTFTQDSLWVWNSAGKTLTAFSVGIAQAEGFLDISDTTSDYLGAGWTSLTPAQEEKITIRHQLTMTSGLNDANFECTTPSCLTYLADPGTRWAYHNSPYTLLDGVISAATGQTLNAFVTQKIKTPIGMNGLYYQSGYNNVFISNARSMARFGLLLLAEGNWNGTPILDDPAYFHDMTNTSQSLNKSYGYLTWLNGKASYMIPQAQIVIPGSAMPNAPSDVFAALGKNGQIINVNPAQNLVVVRMGNNDGNSLVSTQYNDTIWQKINDLGCVTSVDENQLSEIRIYPNPAQHVVNIQSVLPVESIQVIDVDGKILSVHFTDQKLDISALRKGIYFLKIYTKSGEEVHKLLVE